MLARKLCIALVALLAIAGQAMASQITVVTASGDVKTTPVGGKSTAVVSGSSIEPNSVISTGADGKAVVKFEDGQIVAVTANSSTKIGDYYYNAAKPEEGRSSVQFLSGAMRFITGLIGKANPKNVGLTTPQATIGIRGTVVDFAGNTVTVQNGVVSITNAAGQSVTLTAGNSLAVSANGVLTQVPISSISGVDGTFYQSLQSSLTGAAAGSGAAGASAGAISASVSAAAGGALSGAALSSAIASAIASAVAVASKDNTTTDHHATTSHH